MTVNFALDYADKVLAGDIIAGQKIIQAVTRFKNDLKRSEQADFPYYFNNEVANQSIHFMEMLPGTDGQKINMLLFQKWLIAELNGWREKKTENRRYNRAFISMSRKNGKTYLVSGMGSNALLMEKEPAEGRQILFVSNALKQSKIGYNMMANGLRKVTKQSKYMRQRLKILNSQITDLDSNSFAIALASETSTLDGFGATTAILDEWHEAKDRKVYNVIKSGMGNQKNGLLAVVSTAGLNINVPMYEEYEFLTKVLEAKEEADRYFIAIWELDDKEEIHDERLYIKANPIFESEAIKQTMIQAIRDDVALGIKQNNLNSVLVKNFNLWLQASDDSYVAAEDWNATEIESENIQGKDVYVGIDLSKTNDLTSLSWIVPLEDNQFYCDSHSFIGTKYGLQDKIRRDGIDYIQREKLGECTITSLESGIIDYEEVFRWLIDFIQENDLNVLGICYDSWNANSLISRFEKNNYPLIEVRQGARTLNTPTRTFREQLYDGKLLHPANKLLTHAVNNAILKEDNNGIQINKAKNSNRIDPIVALMNAYTEAMFYFEETEGREADNEFYTSENFSF
ncbi:MAG: terminase large subunit [Vagococcus salmoninarum]|uniref:terminase large subunit n=1 Tax=Vagococcus salmoninarum TaxID=2739 RepID=UPI003F9BD752